METHEVKSLPPGRTVELLEAPPKKKRGSHIGWLLLAGGGFIVLLLLLLLVGFLPRHKRQKEIEAAARRQANALPTVNVTQVRGAPAVSQLLLPGSITPLQEAYLYARATGYVKRRYADIGDHVRQGQLLAEIEAPDLDAQVAQGRAALAQAEQQLAQAHASLENSQAQEELARVTWSRYSVLADHGAVSRQDADQQQANYKTAQANVRLQEAGIHSAEENVRANRANLDRLVVLQTFEQVRAPFDGNITARNFDVGALISTSGGSLGASTTPMGGTQVSSAVGNSGSNGSTPSAGGSAAPNPSTPGIGNTGEMYRIAQIDIVRVLVNVPQENAPSMQVGQPATVLVQEVAGHPFEGKLTRTTRSLDPTARTLVAEVDVPNRQSLLLPGMYAQVRFTENRHGPLMLVPGDAVLTTPAGLQVAILQEPTPEQRQQLQQMQQKQQEEKKKESKDEKAQQGQEQQDLSQARRIHLQSVAVGRDYGTEIEITFGLNGGESVIVNPGDEVVEGVLVIPRPAPATAGENTQTPRQGESEEHPSGVSQPGSNTSTPGKQNNAGKKGNDQGQSGKKAKQGKDSGK
ncbi:MAG TPA: efflux RND transporter periplasmic adaptor subunit [Bryobacteraceae bacterium]|nr:efflux RND transporter periplasmic adaptor subunit [Bryobacteraceae bacterium]